MGSQQLKKAFTLVEVLISVALFSIVIIFLYKSLDITKSSNKFYEEKLDIQKEKNLLRRIIFEDIIEAEAVSPIPTNVFDRNKNAIIAFKSSNMYHNLFFTNITYFLSGDNNLVRIESKKKFDHKKITDDFFEYAYIDIIASEVEKFKISNIKGNDKAYSIYIKSKKLGEIFISSQVMR